MKEQKTYEFSGVATVSVVAYVEADSAEEARQLLDDGAVAWECEQIDGDVEDIECVNDGD